MTISVLNAASVTTIIQSLSINGGTQLMQSVPTYPSGSTTATTAIVNATSAYVVQSVSAAPQTLLGGSFYCNATAYPVFLRIYNITAASVASTSTPAITIGIPPGATIPLVLPISGISFGTALSYVVTKLVANNDTTVVASNDLIGAIYYC